MQPTNPIFVLRHLLPVPIRITLERSSSFWIYQHPLPFSPMHPKSWAQSINKNALYSLQTFWVSTRLAVSESMEKSPYVTTKIAFLESFYLVALRLSTIALWSRCGNLIILLVAALAPSCKQLWDSWSMIIWSYSFTSALMAPKPANQPAE